MAAHPKYLVCIMGPTAIGKTALAIRIAQYFHTGIISADSRQFYKEISIGTAKPSAEEMQNVPHHFIGNLSITQRYSAGDFARDAAEKLDELFEKHDLVVLVGGSGLYIRALLDGLDAMPGADEKLRDELDELYASRGITGLQERLKEADPEAFENIDLQNTQRVMRAIEIAESAPDRKQARSQKYTFTPIRIVLDMDRDLLYERINKRVDRMVKDGLIEEALRMLPYKNSYALQTVGYKELFEHFDGLVTLEKAISLIKQHTRNYAKRQLTWFRKEKDAAWFEPSQEEEIIALIRSHLHS